MGWIFILAGCLLRLTAILQLKDKFSLKLRLPTEIITTGAYKYIRHPSYVGTFLILVGLCVMYLPAAVIYLSFMFFLARAINEEQILSINGKYREYQKKTGMFIPRLKWQQ